MLVLAAPALLGMAFLREPWLTGLARPYAKPAVVGSLVGVLCHLASQYARRSLACRRRVLRSSVLEKETLSMTSARHVRIARPSGISTGRRQPGDERRVFGRGAAEVDHGAKPPPVARQERDRDRARGRGRPPNDRCRLRRAPVDEATVTKDEPEDLVRLDGADDVFQHPSPLIVLQLRSQVDVPGRLRDLDDQLRRSWM